jgi:hypothetical protein
VAPTHVAIVTPSLNQGRFIAAAIDSVLSQSHPHLDYIVMDGGSTDETLDVLRSYRGRIRWESGPDAGQAAAINRGFRLVEGEVLGWLNADDLLLPDAVAQAVARLETEPSTALVYGDAEFMDAGGAVIGPCTHVEPFDAGRLSSHGDFIVQPAAFFRRAAFDGVGGLDPSLRFCMDYDLWLKLSAARHSIVNVREKWARVRLHGDTKTERGGLERLEEIEAVVVRNGGRALPAAFFLPMCQALFAATPEALRHRRWSRALRCSALGLLYGARFAARQLRPGRRRTA